MAGQNRFFRLRGRVIEVFGRRVTLPESRPGRILIGTLFIFGGFLWFLPVLGLWMLPLGLLILSIDIALIRRWRRRNDVRWARWRAARRAKRVS
jgi:hypothetical protein